jgi:hypothetical protein
VTRERKLREVLNVRLDEPLARELARIAVGERRSESEVARTLLGYGIEVVRRLQAASFARPFSWQEEHHADLFGRPGLVEIDARWRPMTDDELISHGWSEFIGDDADEWEEGEGA